jgi:hypothetical protein
MSRDFLAEIRRLYDDEKYDEAFQVAEEAERAGQDSPAILVWKSRSLMLSAHSSVSADEVENWLNRALLLDDEYVPAMMELAYFFLNVKDNAAKALGIFQKALPIVKDNATETTLGLAKSLAECDSPEAALAFLSAHDRAVDTSKLEALRLRLKDSPEP